MKWYGSINNRIEENRMFCDVIEVGTGVTEYSWSDRHASQEIRLGPGDVLYIYTDGIVEQPDAQGELFGEESLSQVVAEFGESCRDRADRKSSPMLEAVVAKVMEHGGTVEQADDCTQMLVRYNGENK